MSSAYSGEMDEVEREQVSGAPAGKYTRLPDPIRVEDLRTTQEPGPDPFQRGENDVASEWLLRTAGI